MAPLLGILLSLLILWMPLVSQIEIAANDVGSGSGTPPPRPPSSTGTGSPSVSGDPCAGYSGAAMGVGTLAGYGGGIVGGVGGVMIGYASGSTAAAVGLGVAGLGFGLLGGFLFAGAAVTLWAYHRTGQIC